MYLIKNNKTQNHFNNLWYYLIGLSPRGQKLEKEIFKKREEKEMSRKKSLSLLLAFALTVTSTVAAFAGDVVIAKNTND